MAAFRILIFKQIERVSKQMEQSPFCGQSLDHRIDMSI